MNSKTLSSTTILSMSSVRGNEKGHVEAMVKYVRNNFLLPELQVYDLDKLNEGLWIIAENDRYRNHYQKGQLIAQLFEEDREAFLQLPTKEYECVRYETLKADKYGFIQVEHNTYSTSPRFAKSKVLVKISYNEVVVLTENYQVVVHHSRLYGIHKKSMKWQPYLNLMAKRPLALKYTSFYEQLPIEWQEYLSSCTAAEKSDALRLLSTFLKEYDFTYITKALILASEHGHPSVDAIKQVFYQLINGQGSWESIRPKLPLPPMPEASRGLNHYDQLFKGGLSGE